MTLKGRTTIITGGGRVIGCTCVMQLAADGANITINGDLLFSPNATTVKQEARRATVEVARSDTP